MRGYPREEELTEHVWGQKVKGQGPDNRATMSEAVA